MLSSELQTFLPLEVSDATTNGGRMSANQVVSGVVQNVWSHVPKAERTAGSRKYRKLFDKVSNDSDESLINPGYYLDGDSLGEDWFFFYPVGQRDTQNSWVTTSPPSRKYVAGVLKEAILATATSLTIVFKDAEQASHVLNGDELRISDKTDPDQVSGNESFVTVSEAPSVSGAEVTVTLSAEIGTAYASASSTKVSVMYYASSDIACELSDWTVTTAGDGDADDLELLLDNIGTIEQDWTVTFTGATTFTVAGDTVGALASGSTASEYAPNNPSWTKPYFTLPTALWSGTWASGDTLEFTTSPAAQPLVQERRVPAGCASLANNRIRKVTIGESAV